MNKPTSWLHLNGRAASGTFFSNHTLYRIKPTTMYSENRNANATHLATSLAIFCVIPFVTSSLETGRNGNIRGRFSLGIRSLIRERFIFGRTIGMVICGRVDLNAETLALASVLRCIRFRRVPATAVVSVVLADGSTGHPLSSRDGDSRCERRLSGRFYGAFVFVACRRQPL
jgi:hypothetical protein